MDNVPPPRGEITTPHQDLMDLPPTLEGLDAKLKHLITRFEVGFGGVEKLQEETRLLRLAAEKAANIAVQAAARAEPLTKTQRFVAVTVGDIMGGTAAGAFITLLLYALRLRLGY